MRLIGNNWAPFRKAFPILFGKERVRLSMGKGWFEIPLPEVGVRADEFQTKDTPSQFFEHYEIRADGTLWREAYDPVDRSDPEAKGLGRLAGSLSRENRRWEREYLSGALRFYGNSELG